MSNSSSEFLDALQDSFENDEFPRVVLSAPLKKSSEEVPRKQTLRPIELKNEIVLQWELHFDKLQTHLNLTLAESKERFLSLFGNEYREAYLFGTNFEYTLRATSKGEKLKKRQIKAKKNKQPAQHNRTKNYLIPEGVPIPFLVALGIMTGSGKVKESRQKKFRQINRYLEIVNDVYDQLPAEGPLHVVDFGCGLSYLTFAVHHLLSVIHQREVVLFGIDQKADVIERCELLAHDLNLAGLNFTSGRIEDALQRDKVHLALSLHACDTATDAALTFAVEANADVILAVPCCQHEVFPQIANETLELILKHGILKERIASIATDALRAEALEVAGYKTQILEFIDLEHTPKNLLIRAIRRPESHTKHEAQSYSELKTELGINLLATDQILKTASE
ncbi:MAG: SAM-dependent methyltransferase [Planctomicrobium sp.]|nr:SAM-dependent methyltransferase [Planctomicrobium sp.]